MLCALPDVLQAQLAPLGVPRGMVRLEVGGDFAYARDRFRDGTTESLAANLTSPALGQVAIPTLVEPDQRLAVLLGIDGYRLNLGRSSGSAQFSRTSGTLGMAMGITKHITLFGRMALVDAWNRQEALLDSASADAGVNAASPVMGDQAGQASAQQFLASFNDALATLESRLASGAYDGDPATRTLAMSTLASGRAFADSLDALLVDPATASPFLPRSSSPAGAILDGRVTNLQSTLSSSLGVEGFTQSLPLPAAAATGDDLGRYATASTGPVAYETFNNSRLTKPGDVTLGAVVTALDRWDPVQARGIRVAIEGSAQLATGQGPSAVDALGTATGAGAALVRGGGAVDLGWGVVGLRLQGSYTARMGSTTVQRISSPIEALVPAARTADLRYTGGNELRLGAAPYLRLARALGLQVTTEYASRADDNYAYASAADSIPGIPASLLAQGTGASRLVMGVGVIYSSGGRRPDGTEIRPLDAGWKWETVVSSSGGIQTRWSVTQAYFRYYARLW